MKARRLCYTYLWPHKGVILATLLAMLMQTVMDLLGPLPLKLVFDSVLGKHELPDPLKSALRVIFGTSSLTKPELHNLPIAAMLGVALIDALFTLIGGLLTRSIGQRMIHELRVQIFDHIQRLSISFHRNSRVGDLSARLTSDIQSIQDMVASGLNSLITNALPIVGVLLVVAQESALYGNRPTKPEDGSDARSFPPAGSRASAKCHCRERPRAPPLGRLAARASAGSAEIHHTFCLTLPLFCSSRAAGSSSARRERTHLQRPDEDEQRDRAQQGQRGQRTPSRRRVAPPPQPAPQYEEQPPHAVHQEDGGDEQEQDL